jgi:hypothetical protein
MRSRWRTHDMHAPEQKPPRARAVPGADRSFAAGTARRAISSKLPGELPIARRKVGAFVTLEHRARRDAADRVERAMESGQAASPIDGMPMGIKDIIETADMPTEMGSPLFAGWRSRRTRPACRRCGRRARSFSARR